MQVHPEKAVAARLTCVVLLTSCAILTGCAGNGISDDVNLTPITFPNGKKIVAETLRNEFERMRGMMYRDSLPADRGMLFVHEKEDKYTYWMYQTRIPLDLIWLNRQHKIVEISPNAPPCTTKASECPKYGGHQPANFVLEVNAGAAAKNNLQPGDFIDF